MREQKQRDKEEDKRRQEAAELRLGIFPFVCASVERLSLQKLHRADAFGQDEIE